MRFSTIIVSGVLAALSVSAQNTTSAVVSGTAALNPAQSSQAACLSACPATDPKCRDSCIVDPTDVPNPAIACINSCIQGNGTAADNAAYESCQRNCRSSAAAFMATATPAPTGSAATKSGAGVVSSTGSAGTVSSGSNSQSTLKTATTSSGASAATGGSATTSGAPAATSSSAAISDNVRVGMSVAGAFGVFAAVLAL